MNRFKLIFVMIVWGSLGVFTKSIPLSALQLAFLRALIALPVLYIAIRRNRRTLRYPWRQILPYLVSGLLLGFAWLTLFYGFKLTSVASAIIIYNMCPVYVMISAPLLLKEKVTTRQIAVILFSFVGLLLIVGQNILQGLGILGMLLSALSGMLYAAIVLINRNIKHRIENQTATFFQILTAMLVLLPFVLLEGDVFHVFRLDVTAILFTLLLGVLHTGISYTMFFSVYEQMKSVEIVTYSYFEPLSAILFGFIFLSETLTPVQIAGGILILGSTYIGEMLKRKSVDTALRNKA